MSARRTRLPVFEETLRQVVSVLETLADEDRLRWLELLSNIDALVYHDRQPDEHETLRQTVGDSVRNDRHRQEVYDMSKTMAEYLKEEGRQEGRQEGEVLARQNYLLRLLRHKFGKLPAAVVRRIKATEQLELLDRWFDQTSAAQQLQDVSFAAE